MLSYLSIGIVDNLVTAESQLVFSCIEQLMYLQYLVTLSVCRSVRPPFYVNIIQTFMLTQFKHLC